MFKGVDNVFHLAALADIVPSIENPQNYFTTNVNGTFNVLKASLENKVVYSHHHHLVMAYQKNTRHLKMRKFLQNIYALTKIRRELVLHFADVYKLNATSLRF